MKVSKLSLYRALKEYFQTQTNRQTQGWVAKECEEIIRNLDLMIDFYRGGKDVAPNVVIHHEIGPFGIKIEETN